MGMGYEKQDFRTGQLFFRDQGINNPQDLMSDKQT